MTETPLHVIHTTERNNFKKCRTLFDFSSPNRQSLEKIWPSQPLRFGTGFHTGAEVYYAPATWNRGSRPEAVVDAAVAAALAAYPFPGERSEASDEDIETWHDECATLEGMLRHYAQWAPSVDHFTPLYAEIKFQVPIFARDGDYYDELRCVCHNAPVYYGGKIDLIVQDDHGDIWIVDHKTASKFGNTEWLAMDEQISSYCWAVQQMLGIKVSGFIYNQMLKSVPHKPHINKNGNISVDKRQNTTLELVLTTIRENGYDVGSYVDFLNFLREQPNKFFRRTPVNRSPRQLQILGDRLAVEATEMLNPNLHIYPTPSEWNCGRCDFQMPCLAQMEGADFGPVMGDFYKVRESDDV